MSNKKELVRNLPIARFWYKGNHTHPVRRVVAVTSRTRKQITGYELREGNEVREDFADCPVKTYNRDQIALIKQIDARRSLRKNTPKTRQHQTTLKFANLKSLETEGI